MPAITASVTLRIPGELLERVDRLVATSRNAWLLWVIEQAVERAETEEKYSPSTRAVERTLGEQPSGQADAPVPAPAEQPEDAVGLDEALTEFGVTPVDDSTLTRVGSFPTPRAFRPYPKGGK